MSCAAIVLSAGAGTRMNSDIPKQYMMLGDAPVICHSLRAFGESAVDEIILVCGQGDVDFCRENIVKKYGIKKVSGVVEGGAERYLSVYEGLKATAADYVLIHDGARPLVSKKLIADSIAAVAREQACVPAVPVKDTIKVASEDGYAIDTPRRETLFAVQTPQSFSRQILLDSYEKLFSDQRAGVGIPTVTDDAMIVEYATGRRIRLIVGDPRNIKITAPEDLVVAEALMQTE